MATLEQVLLNTLNKDEHVRKAAEVALNEACIHPGYTVALLKVACESNNPKEVRQAASVALKNGIKRNWTTPEDEARMLMMQQSATSNGGIHNNGDMLSGKYTIPQQDRDVVRANILQGLSMVRSDNESLRRILAECVGILAEHDFPDRWPSFIPEIVAMLSNVNDRD
ncbi:MAG TPA: hypothetical protein VEF04_13920, partial [Blastocatellia bacterium]|nr:hypothetical protein [Blastocatellia bacterium]